MDSSVMSQTLALLRGEGARLVGRSIDWDALVKLARSQRIAPLIYAALRRHGLLDGAPEHIVLSLKASYGQTRAENALRIDVMRNALASLAEKDIPAAPLKGAALIAWTYKDIGLRPMSDLDLLVPPAQAERAVDVLLREGYRRTVVELRPGYDREFRGELELQAPGPAPYWFELHWRLIDVRFIDRHVDYAELWQRAEHRQWRGQLAFCLSVEDSLMHQAAHAVYRHRHVGLLALHDIDVLVRSASPSVDWDRLMRIGQCCRWLPAAGQVLSQAAALLGTPVPRDFLEQAFSYAVPRPERWVLKAWLNSHVPESSYPILDWLSLPGVGARVRFAHAYLFPTGAFVRSCYPEESALPIVLLRARRSWSRATGLFKRPTASDSES